MLQCSWNTVYTHQPEIWHWHGNEKHTTDDKKNCSHLLLHDFPSWQWGRWLRTFFIVWQCGNWQGASDEPVTCCRLWHLWACSNNTSCCWIIRGLSISAWVCEVFGLESGPVLVLRGLTTPQSYNKQVLLKVIWEECVATPTSENALSQCVC